MYRKIFVCCLSVFIFIGQVHAHEKEDPAKYATSQLIIDGVVKNPLKLNVDELRKKEMVTLNGVPMRCSETRIKSEGDQYSGILLRDLLEEAEVDIESHREKNHLYLVASASDDYHVVFSWHEVMNTSVGDGVLVFLNKNGNPIDVDEGYIAMISAADQFTCARHIKWLQSITVQRFSPAQ